MATVLIVDEDVPFTRSLQILLEDEGGHQVRVAHSMPGALAELERDEAIAAVISDLVVPQGSGLDLLALVRQRYNGMAVVLLTAHPEPLSRLQAARLGASHYLAKPVEPESLLTILEASPARIT